MEIVDGKVAATGSGESVDDVVPVFPWYEIADWISYKLGLCREGSWSEWVADKLFIDCYCCYAMRCISVGWLAGVAMTVTAIAAYPVVSQATAHASAAYVSPAWAQLVEWASW